MVTNLPIMEFNTTPMSNFTMMSILSMVPNLTIVLNTIPMSNFTMM